MSDDNLQRVVNAFLTGERGGLSTTETALLEIVADGGSDFESFIETWRNRGLAGSPCTSVWTAGAIAYRCRTCQTNDSSAICVTCFKAGGHEEHDYVLYRSESGGCCDCGDVASWEPSGCCPLHRPSLTSAQASAVLPTSQRDAVQELLALVLERLTLALELLAATMSHFRDDVSESTWGEQQNAAFVQVISREHEVADSCIAWLRHVCSATALRAPAGAALLLGMPSTTQDASPGSQLRELLRREKSSPAGTQAQQLLRHDWLSAIESQPIRDSLCIEDLEQRHTWPLVDRMLFAPVMHALPAALLEHLTTMLLLLLYDRPFKEQFTYALLRHYRALVCTLAPQQSIFVRDAFSVMHCLDRITVQLFNAPETTMKLALNHRLLDILLGLLCQELSPWAMDGAELYNPVAPAWPPEAVGTGDAPQLMVDLSRNVSESRIFTRVVGDLRMVFSHPTVALHMLSSRRDLVHLFLRILGALQGANGIVRKWGEHVEEESQTWMNAVTLEQSLVSLWTLVVEVAAEAQPQPLKRSLSSTDAVAIAAAASASTPVTRTLQPRTMALVYAAAAALRAAAEWSHADALAAPEFNLDVNPVSVHLPLHRVAAAAVSTLVSCLPADADGVTGVAALLRGSEWLDTLNGAPAGVPLAWGGVPGLMRHPARVLAWAAAVRARMWVRNGIAVSQLEAVYSSAFWAEAGYDLDLAAMQLALSAATSADEAENVALELMAHTAAPELTAAVDKADAQHTSIEEADPSLLARVRDALFDAAVLARDRSFVSALPHGSRVRSGIIHVLALRDCTHTQLIASLPSSLAESDELDEILDEVADFAEPRGAEAGHYSLKPTVWAEWDPHCSRYSRSDVEQATARALEFAVPTWRHAIALRPPSARPLQPFANLSRFTRSQYMLRIVRAVLRYGLHGQGALRDDLIAEALQLVALAAADATAAGGAVTTSPDVQVLASILSNPGPGDSPGVLDLIIAAAATVDDGTATSGAVSEIAASLLADLRARGLAPPASDLIAILCRPPLADAAAAAREERRRAMRERQRAVMAAFEAQQRAFAAKTGASDDDDDSSVAHTDGVNEFTGEAGESDGDETASSSTDMSVEGEAGLSDTEDDEAGECALCRGDAVPGRGPDASTGALAWVSLAQCSNIPAISARPQQQTGISRTGSLPHGIVPLPLSSSTNAVTGSTPAQISVAAASASLDVQPGVHVGVCGHRVHTGCLDRYVSELRASYAAGRHFPGEYVLAVGAGEFLCPVCRRLANGLLPALPPDLRSQAGDDDDNEDADGKTTISVEQLADAARAMVRGRITAPSRVSAEFSALGATGADASALSSSPRSFSSAEKCSGSARGSGRFLRRRSSNAAALLYATAADTATDRFSDRCRALLTQLHSGHVVPVIDDADPSGSLWAVLAYNVVHWEVASRTPEVPSIAYNDPPVHVASARAVEKSPHWVAMQALCRLALRATGGPQTAASASEPSHALAQACRSLLPWLLGDDFVEEPASVILGALPRPEVVEVMQTAPRRSVQQAGGETHHAHHVGAHGTDLLRALITGLRIPNATVRDVADHVLEPPVVPIEVFEEEDANPPPLPSVDEDMPMEMPPTEPPLELEPEGPARAKVSQLLAAGDVFAIFCELAAAAAFSSASSTTSSADLALSPPPSAWTPALARKLARLCACISVAQAAAATGLAAAGAALTTRPLDALGAVADTICEDPESPASRALSEAIIARITPTLRRCAVLTALLSGSAAPSSSISADEVLTSQLRLPSFDEILAAISEAADDGMPAVERWVSMVSSQPGLQSSPPTLGGRDALRAWLASSPTVAAAAKPVALRPPSLIKLPVLYQDLYLEWAERPCLVCRTVPHEPALCLVCGRLVCCAGECCVLPGGKHECAAHALTCGAGVGIYLLIKATKLMVLRAGRKCLYPSPYLDAHGEEDMYLRRGRPLYLSAERYALVQHLWATSALDYDTHTLHTSRSGANFY